MTVFDNPYIKQLGILPYQAQQQQSPLEGLLSPRGLVSFGANMLANPNENFFQQLGQGIGGAVGAVDAYNNSLNKQAMDEAKYNLMVAGLASDYDVAQMNAQAATAQQQMLMNAFGRLGMLGGGLNTSPITRGESPEANNMIELGGVLGSAPLVSAGKELAKQEQVKQQKQEVKGLVSSTLNEIRSTFDSLNDSDFGPVQSSKISRIVGQQIGSESQNKRDAYEASIAKLAAQLTPLIRPPGSGTWTDADQERLEKMLPDLSKSKQTNKKIIDSLYNTYGIQTLENNTNIDGGMGISGLPEPTPEGGIIGEIKSKLPEIKKQKNRLKYNPSTGDFE